MSTWTWERLGAASQRSADRSTTGYELVVFEQAEERIFALVGPCGLWRKLCDVVRLAQRIEQRLELVVEVAALTNHRARTAWLEDHNFKLCKEMQRWVDQWRESELSDGGDNGRHGERGGGGRTQVVEVIRQRRVIPELLQLRVQGLPDRVLFDWPRLRCQWAFIDESEFHGDV
jgi:hypothetical protein